ncbi:MULTISPECIES: response regulator transcription factor [Bifidobacterium]|uniref:Two component transcriptional regulator, winged helix family n=1 Tax=Bifidobacterium reuteri DSM 23975 TaxID=1437610 RepID=A0A087CNZ5_9BIFI|nr:MULTISPECIES: response regulator transcription factor [Bifidobacterium]KFI84995.1 two component transcriptional regulator, winged helix family [Bifidobacterium reuteri DSM 23975]TPF77402.1 hypothetical protein BW09_09885 [Bifidobacterium sp. UTCIF-1]TPF79415.1 hypothetical protein BW08_10165 [Bifidobacterium sp. UTCIF-24]TPF81396.1 hypothetical protein BW12_10300 [Bifidobacterium sp. UTCIF-3]TPF83498.1 hypothetical protein BW07_09875 [Bifidobacterium sp. UTCIF-36]
MAGILIVEDNTGMVASLDDALRHEGYRTWTAGTGVEALELLAAHREDIDVVLLDRDLPVMSGDTVMTTIRSMGIDVSVLMVTASSSLEDRVEGLDLGADDYLTKPFAFRELSARIRALLRHDSRHRGPFGGGPGPDSGTGPSPLMIDCERRLAYWHETPLNLTAKEFAVLWHLDEADGGWVGLDELIAAVWPNGSASTGAAKTVIYTLRQKIEHAGGRGAIESARGKGYRLP